MTSECPLTRRYASAYALSGGQTGVDRAALDAAPQLGLACGGWCPHGRAAEDGVIAAGYSLRETPTADPAQRTAWNVRDADATLVVTRGAPAGGTLYTLECIQRIGQPHAVIDVRESDAAAQAVRWLLAHDIGTLNVAGPRESECPGMYAETLRLLTLCLADHYTDTSGLLVFTPRYLLARSYCCKNGCRHCPYGYVK